MKLSILGLLPLLSGAVYSSPMVNIDSIDTGRAPVTTSSTSKVIPDSYIIVFKDHVTQLQATAHHDWVQDVHSSGLRKRTQIPLMDAVDGSLDYMYKGLKHTYDLAEGFLGYSGHFDEHTLDQIRRHPDVSSMI